MSDDESFDIDPAIAEAMGFSGFGMQPGKKRKFDTNDGFVDPSAKKQATPPNGTGIGKGANNMPLGIRTAREPTSMDNATTPSTLHGDTRSTRAAPESKPVPGPLSEPELTGQARMEALRKGLKNEKGDMVYFLPSFIADPWEGLQPQ